MTSDFTSATSLPPLGVRAVHDGVEYSAGSSWQDRWFLLEMDRRTWETFRSADEIARSDASDGRYWVKVSADAISRTFRRVALGTWEGREVGIRPMDDERALIVHDEFPEWAHSMGMSGDQYNGFEKVVAFNELTDVRIVEHEDPIP
jgi:hypothetical protein